MLKRSYKQGRIFVFLLAILMIVVACSTGQKTTDRLLGRDLSLLESQLSRKVQRGNTAAVLQLAEVQFQLRNFQGAYEKYRYADSLGMLTTPQFKRNYVHAGRAISSSTPYDTKTGYFNTDLKFDAFITPFCGNSRNEDIVPYQWKEYLFVTSSRKPSFTNYPVTGKPFLNVIAFGEGCQPMNLPDFLPRKLNTRLNDGPIAISGDGNLVILNRNYTKKNKEGYQHLYLDYFVNQGGNWSQAIRFPFGDENYSIQHPFYNDKEQALYFSSDMPGGRGGFDLYKSKWNGSSWAQPVNLGADINTVYDEVFPSFTPDGVLVYSTNHVETLGGLDLVMFKEGKRMLLPAPINTPFDDFGATFASATTGYLSSTRNRAGFADNVFFFSFIDKTTKEFFVQVVDKDTKAPIEGALVKYNAAKSRISEQVITNLRGMGYLFSLPEAEPVAFDVTLAGYQPAKITISNFKHDAQRNIFIGTVELAKEVIKKEEVRSASFVVYFENDIPRPGMQIPSYAVTFDNYMRARRVYLRRTGSPRAEMEAFFADVEKGMDDLRQFASFLYDNRDKKLEINISGYASPLAMPEYNQKLTERRIASVKAYLEEWGGGLLKLYLSNGHFILTAVPYGDTKAPPHVSANPNERAKSVYSVEASKERRVTIYYSW